MFFRLILICLMCLMGTFALAQKLNITHEFEAKHLSKQEKRVLQAALAREGYYQGLLDGAWGKGSQSALAKMSKARGGGSYVSWQEVVDLEQRLREELDAQGWRSVQSQGVSLLAPMSLLTVERARRGQALVSDPKGLQVRIMPQNIAEALNLANAVTARHSGSDRPYQSLNNRRLIVSAALKGGGGIYMRTNEIGGGLITALLEWTPEHAGRARIMLSSIAKGEQADLDLPWDGTLAKLARSSDLTPGNSTEATGAEDTLSGFWPKAGTTVAPTPQPRRNSRVSGSAFFVNNTDLVTAAHVVQGCKSISLPGLGAARVIAADPSRNLALITSAKRSADWVDVSRATPDKGDNMIVVGFASERADRQEFFAHSVVVDRRAAAKGESGNVALKRNVPNADHGSLVLDFDRKLAGLIVRHPNPTRRTRHTYVASAANLRGFLRDNNVMFSRGSRNGPRPMTEDSLKTTVWRVACDTRG